MQIWFLARELEKVTARCKIQNLRYGIQFYVVVRFIWGGPLIISGGGNQLAMW